MHRGGKPDAACNNLGGGDLPGNNWSRVCNFAKVFLGILGKRRALKNYLCCLGILAKGGVFRNGEGRSIRQQVHVIALQALEW